jgi:methyl-accepting chemotaxis protein
MDNNMISTASVVRNSPSIVVKFGAILMLPWIWAVLVMPPWASAVCAGLWTVGLFAAIRLFVAPMFARRRAGEESLSPEQIMKMRAPSPGPGVIVLDQDTRGDLGSLHNGLRRWQESSTTSSGETATARERVGEVISQTENAVLALTMSFRGITTKTREQMEAAMSLLKRNAEQVNISPGTWLSLPDYIRAYEMQLQEVIESMVKFTSTSDEMLQHQTKIREQSVLIDELLDELRAMAIRIGRLALDSAVAAGDSGKHGNYLIELSGSIRETSNQAFGLTRSIRQSLETIRDELVVTYKVINKTCTLAKESAQRAKADVAQLNVTMIAKTKEVEESLSKINSLGAEIQQDVNSAFIAMQFQDITQQKLEHMRGNILTDVMSNLDTVSVETQEMMKKKIFLAATAAANDHETAPDDASAATPRGPSSASDADEMAALDAEISDLLEAPDRAPTVIKEVELF